MSAILRCAVPINKMGVRECIEVLEDNCDPESARQVAAVLRSVTKTLQVLEQQRDSLEKDIESLIEKSNRVQKQLERMAALLDSLPK